MIYIYTFTINPLPLRVAVVDGILMMESHPLTGTDSKAIEDHPIILFLLDKFFDLLVQDCPAEVRYAQDIGCSEFRLLRKEVDEEVLEHIILVIASASFPMKEVHQLLAVCTAPGEGLIGVLVGILNHEHLPSASHRIDGYSDGKHLGNFCWFSVHRTAGIKTDDDRAILPFPLLLPSRRRREDL